MSYGGELNVDWVVHLHRRAHFRQPREVVAAARLEDVAELEGAAEVALRDHDDVLERGRRVGLEFARPS